MTYYATIFDQRGTLVFQSSPNKLRSLNLFYRKWKIGTENSCVAGNPSSAYENIVFCLAGFLHG